METSEAIKARKSVRAFLPREVGQSKIERLLELAACSPSGANTQPWSVHVVTGVTKARLQQALLAAFASALDAEKDYNYYPLEWKEVFKQRRVSCGQQLYDALEIERGDRDGRRAQWARNYRAFDAPVMLIFTLDKSLEAGSYLDTGMFLQTLMLAAVDMGLATCPEAALAEYPDIVREHLAIQDDIVLCGMALGYEDEQHAVNQYRTPRAKVGDFTGWHQ